MKKIIKQFPLAGFSLFAAAAIILCAWQNAPNKNHFNNGGLSITQKDTTPEKYNDQGFDMGNFNEAMKNLDVNMNRLNEQMKNLDINFDKQIGASLSKINFDEIEKQTEASINAIDWNNIQKKVNASLQNAQKEIAKIDFSKMQNDMKDLQEKLKSEQFKMQLNSEKMHQQTNDAMSKVNEGINKAKQQLQKMKDFTNELTTDGLIDKKKGYTLEWKNGNLYINGTEQSRNISDKYRKYESTGKIMIQPENAEHF